MHKRRISISEIVITVLLSGVALACLIPVLNTIAISFSDKTSAALGRVFLWPVKFTTASYEPIWQEKQFMRSFMNSSFRVILGGSINVLFCILMAYPLSKNHRVFRMKNVYMWFIVFTMLFYGGLVPSFILVKNIGLIDKIWALVLPEGVSVFNVIILMNYFRTIPESLEEAAYMDGANPIYILWKIFVPLGKPAIAVIALFSVVWHWNEFFFGRIFINTPIKMPLQTYIQSLNVNLTSADMQAMSPEEIVRKLERSSLTFNSAKVTVSMVPMLIIYPFLQKYFVSGMVMGAVKE